ncbi:MAG: xanthine dehydrogenase family protein molybdopterin-binding subunit [Burkholderiaceae bacterium]
MIGQSPLRREDDALLTGQGCFVDDVPIADALHVRFARADLASGLINGIDVSRARSLPGVVAVYTGTDVASLGGLTVNKMLAENYLPGYPILAFERIMAVGQPFAAVVADTPAHAQDAIEQIDVQIVDLPVQLNFSAADQQPLFDEIAGNIAMASQYQQGNWKQTCNDATFIVSACVTHPRLMASPMENRAVAVRSDTASGAMTIWLSTQTPHRAKQELCRMAEIEPELVRVIAPDVGGAFGMKASLYPEEVLVVWAAHQLRRSLRWSSSRGEDMLSATHGRGAISTGSLALDKDGRFLGLQAEVVCPLGYWLPTSAAVPAWNAARILPGPYRIDTVDIKTRAVLTNTAPVGIYRGAGRPEAAALMEQLVNKAAVVTGLDARRIRERNLLPPGSLPHTGPTGRILDSGDYQAALSDLCELAGFESLQLEQKKRRTNGELVGIGIACFVEPCGQGWESARVTAYRDGRVSAATGGSTQGHGRSTAFAQIVAQALEVSIESVDVSVGDTATCPTGIGALASRSTAIGGSAVLQASRQVRAQIDQEGWGDGSVAAEVMFEASGEAWGYGCYLAMVCIDEETGQVTVEKIVAVDDAGIRINPMLVAGQISGGIAQGVGEALFERVVYDEIGQLMTGSLMDYALPRAADMPEIVAGDLCTPSPVNPLGAKGVGEAGTIGAPAAILGAVEDALSPLGVKHVSMPISAESVWRAIIEARAARKNQ